jgi:hypothetical protein
MQQIQKYKILAFITLCKKSRNNSVLLYKNESIVNRCKELHIGFNTFKKFKQICLENSLLKEVNGHLIFVKMLDILTFLNDGIICEKNLTFNRFVLFFNYITYDNISYKNIYNQIRKSLVLKNYKQQEYNIKRNKSFIKDLGHGNKKAIKVLIKQARSLGKSTAEYLKCLPKHKERIVSGKNHISKIIGMSPSTGQRLLKELSQKEVTRIVITKQLSNIIQGYDLDSLRALNPGKAVHLTKSGTFMYLGSIISLKKTSPKNCF